MSGTPGKTPTSLRTLPADRYGEFRPVGEGGMGIVYLAIDSDLNREVAFKVIRPGPAGGTEGSAKRPTELVPPSEQSHDSRSFRALKRRFLQEAWITSSMAHPGIVPVYELGQTAEGIPYYTMRFIGGERTLATAIHEAAGKVIEERLALLEPFLKVCDAVRYAHSRGVIHRDLKPRNIAIGEFGEVVLLDWGLARFKGDLDPVEDDRLQAHVREYRAANDLQSVAGALGTPGYMGPEALRGKSEVMDERSDVYSLGVMLFEILTGRLPFDFESFVELATRLLGEDAPRAGDIDGSVPDGLSRLCEACLSREMDRRPESADAVATAIRRWQVERERERKVDDAVAEANRALSAAREKEGEERIHELDHAVAARGRLLSLRPDHPLTTELSSTISGLRKRGIWERDRALRRRLLKRVGVFGLGVATAATVLVALLLEGRRQEAEQAHARETVQRARAEDLAAYMLGDLREQLEPVGRLDLLRDVATKSLQYYESVAKENLTENDRRARGLALGNIGDVLLDTGDLDAAEELFLESMGIFEGLVAKDPRNPEWQRDLSVSRNRLGDVLQETGRLKEALGLYHAALEARRGLVGEDSAEPLARDDVARSLDRVGDVLTRLGDRPSAVELHEEALGIRRALVSDVPDDPKWLSQLSASLVKIGDVRAKSGDLPGALEFYGDAFLILDQLLDGADDDSKQREDLAGCVFRIGYVLEETGDGDAALERYLRSLEIYRRLAEGDPSNAWWQRNIALSLDRVAHLVDRSGDRKTALEHYREAERIREGLAGRDPGNTRAAHDQAASHRKVGDFAKASGNLKAARESYEKALGIARRLVEAEPENTEWQSDLALALNRVASVSRMEQDPAAAETEYSEAASIHRRLLELDPTDTEGRRNLALNLLALGDIARDGEDPEAARGLYEESLGLSRRLAEDEPTNLSRQTDLVTILNRTADVASRLDDSGSALRFHEQATAVNRLLLRDRPDDAERLRELSYNLYYIGVLHEAAGHVPEGLDALREAEALHRRAVEGSAGYAPEHGLWTAAYQRLVLRAGDERLDTPRDHLTLAYLLHAREDYAGAAQQFAKALEDSGIRSDLPRGNLYNAACSAALAEHPGRAIEWLTEDLRLRRAELAGIEARMANGTDTVTAQTLSSRAQALHAHFEHARVNDPDLESLRAHPEFAALFE